MIRFPVVPAALLLCWSSAVRGQNLLANSGFENATPSDYWQMWKSPEATEGEAAISFPAAGAHQGARYARVEVTAAAVENWHIQLQIPPDWVADSGAVYELKFWARSDSSSGIHLGIQEGPANNYTYRAGMDFALSPEWTEYSLVHESDRNGNGAIRFNLYLGRYKDTYGFDAFSLSRQAVGLRGSGKIPGEAGMRQEPGRLILALGEDASAEWKAELFDLRGTSLSAASGKADRPLILARPRESGIYFIRANASGRTWARKVRLR